MNNSPIDYLPIFIMFTIAVGFAAVSLIATHALGPKRKTKVKLESFECGIETQGNLKYPDFSYGSLYALKKQLKTIPTAPTFTAQGLKRKSVR